MTFITRLAGFEGAMIRGVTAVCIPKRYHNNGVLERPKMIVHTLDVYTNSMCMLKFKNI